MASSETPSSLAGRLATENKALCTADWSRPFPQESGLWAGQGLHLPCLHCGAELGLGMQEPHKYQWLECREPAMSSANPEPPGQELGCLWETGGANWPVAWSMGLAKCQPISLQKSSHFCLCPPPCFSCTFEMRWPELAGARCLGMRSELTLFYFNSPTPPKMTVLHENLPFF